MGRFLKSNFWLLLILLIALMFRFWQIGSLPGGLFPDEAANGLDVNLILKGDLQPFYERGNGREALFFYLLALSVALFGRGPWQHHIVSAGLGFIEVVATYLLAKRLFGKNVGLLAAFLMATSSFAVTLSRTAFRANTLPLFATLALLFLIKYFQSGNDGQAKTRSAIWAGVFFGLGFYTYISFRMMIPLLLAFGLILLFANRGRLKLVFQNHKKFVWQFAAAFLAAFSWIGYYFIRHPETFGGRAGQVSIFSKDLNHGDILGTFFEVSKLTIAGFFSNGDINWRHNVAGHPFLSPFLSPFFAVSLVLFTLAIFRLLKQTWQKNVQSHTLFQALLASWFWVMLVPEVLTAEGIPHGLRLVGVIPAIFILPAASIVWVWQKFKKMTFMYNTKIVLATIFIVSIFFYNFILYFYVAAGSPDYYYAFRSDLTAVSKYLNARNKKTSTFLSLDKFSVQTVDYLTTHTGNPYVLLDPAQTYKVALQKGDQVMFTKSTLFDRLKFLEYHGEAKLIRLEKNKFGEIIMLVYQQP